MSKRHCSKFFPIFNFFFQIFERKKVFPGQAAEKVGIQMADQIVEVDGISLVGVSHSFAADTLRSTSTVSFWKFRTSWLCYFQQADKQVFQYYLTTYSLYASFIKLPFLMFHFVASSISNGAWHRSWEFGSAKFNYQHAPSWGEGGHGVWPRKHRYVTQVKIEIFPFFFSLHGNHFFLENNDR